MERIALDNDIKYIDNKDNLFRTRAEVSISKMLSFLGQNFEYDVPLKLKNNDIVNVDFKIDGKYIEVIDCENDVNEFLRIRGDLPEIKSIAVGHSKYAGRVNELDSFFFFNSDYNQTGSIFIEDPSIDFGEAKRIIKETLNILDHKFFINTKYLQKEDDLYYHISFEGPRGFFSLQLPKMTTFLLPGEATVENLSTEIIKLLAPKMPSTVEALGIYVYEGVNKGAHIIAEIKKG